MRTNVKPFVVGAVALVGVVSTVRARAAVGERGYYYEHRPVIVTGPSAEALLGGGIDNRYGFAIAGRLGVTLDSGVYLGGSVAHYNGEASSGETLLGGDLGFKAWLAPAFELRPYAFLGASIIDAGNLANQNNETRFAFQPGLLAAYHFGAIYLAGEGRVQVTPTPAAGSLLGGAGVTF
jgi:hypothetical protein